MERNEVAICAGQIDYLITDEYFGELAGRKLSDFIQAARESTFLNALCKSR